MKDMTATVSSGAPSLNAERARTAKIRIVIADDHPIFRDGLRRLLALEEDFEVVTEAYDGKGVLEVFQQLEPDILLLDLKMPGLDGLGTLQELQAPKCKTKVIVLTASEDTNEFIQAMRFGARGVVVKGTATDLLMKSIRKVHAGEVWMDSNLTRAVMGEFANPSESSPSSARLDRERPPLSQREREIVALVAQGYKNKEVAEKLFMGEQTVKNHLHQIFKRLGISDRLALALYAIHNNGQTPP